MSAQFFGRSGKVLYGAFSIVGMASQSHNVNKGIPDDRVARSTMCKALHFLTIPVYTGILQVFYRQSCSLQLPYIVLFCYNELSEKDLVTKNNNNVSV